MNTSLAQRLALALAAFASSVALAQTAPVPTPAQSTPVPAKKNTSAVEALAAPSEETLVLSPFITTTDKDNGYQATSTLAGTRLSTELKDVGTSISVITTQFLQDTGATDTKSLLSYVTGSEVGGLAGNFSGGSVGGPGNTSPSENLGPQTSTRLRGLAGASEARNFYNTSIPLDGYNVERVEVNRGANAILFGTGSPAGIINSSLKKPDERKVCRR
jgi:outer membrane receptor protein involved in Fe transport